MTTNNPEAIYLIDTGDGVVWCDDRDPTGDGECDDAVKYVRGDAYESLREECEQLRKGAERYSWLRNDCLKKGGHDHWAPVAFLTDDSFGHNQEALMGEALDSAIDAAMRGASHDSQ